MATKAQAVKKKTPIKKTTSLEVKAKYASASVGKIRSDPRRKKIRQPEKTVLHPNHNKTFFELSRMDPRQLQQVFDHGVTPTFDELLGWEFRGFNPPIFARILGFQKFKKGMFLDKGQTKDGNAISGYNVFVRQNFLEDPHLATPSEDNPKRHGYYIVSTVDPGATDNKYPQALLLNYGIGKNASYNPERVIRDYLVKVTPDNPDLFLGKAFIALGPARIFSNFFILERYNESNFDPSVLG